MTRKWLIGIGALALLLAAAISPATAQTAPEPPTERADEGLARFLSAAPVTLLDWGMMRLERDIDRAVRRLGLDKGRGEPPRTGTLFRFQDRRVLLYLSASASGSTRTESYCRDLFGLIRGELLAGAPGGPDGAEWYLTRLFSSDVWRERDRPDGFGAKLLDMVHLEVTLLPPPSEAFGPGPGKIACAGRLDADTAWIVQPWRPAG